MLRKDFFACQEFRQAQNDLLSVMKCDEMRGAGQGAQGVRARGTQREGAGHDECTPQGTRTAESTVQAHSKAR